MNLMESFADPGLIPNLSVSEKLIGSGITALMGMGVTFLVLFFLWGCIAVLAKFMKPESERKHQKKGPSGDNKSTVTTAIKTAGQWTAAETPLGKYVDHCGNLAHVVAIAAAVTAYEEGNNSLIIREIKRLPDRRLWSNNIMERMFSR